MKVLVVHGPNLNLLGTREVSVYGRLSLDQVNQLLAREAAELDVSLEVHQTAREGEIIELLHAASGEAGGALVNPAAYSHTSRAIAEAVDAVDYPVVEVHLTNIHAREPWRAASVTAGSCAGIVAGFGAHSYTVALRALTSLARD